MSLFINEIAYHLPKQIVTNEDMAAENSSWDLARISGKSGVTKRHIAMSNETALDLALEACKKINLNNKFSLDSVDAIIFCTQTPDYIMPPNSCILQKELGLSDNIIAFDYNLACSGYVYGLAIVNGLLASGLAHNCLLVTGDTYSKYINKRDRSARVLFGDGATVSWISDKSFGKSLKLVDVLCATNGAGYDKFIIPAGACRISRSAETAAEQMDSSGNWRTQEQIYMDGMGILEFVVGRIPVQIKNILAKNHMAIENVDFFVFHQASKLILDTLTKLLRVDSQKIFNNIASIGNTVSSSIPIALSQAKEDNVLPKEKGKVLISGFGVGLSWATAILEVG